MASKVLALSAILFLYLAGVHSLTIPKCQIHLATDFHPSNPPMVISLTDRPNYVYPTASDSSEIVIAAGQNLTIACPKKTNRASSMIVGDSDLQWNEKVLFPEHDRDNITCLGSEFNLDGNKVKLASVSCAEKARASYSPILREAGSCLNGERYEIGYELDDGLFLRTLELCHDKKEDRTLWAHDVIQPVNTKSNRFKEDNRKAFKTGILYSDISMAKDHPYSLEKAFETLAATLKSKQKASKYLSPVLSNRKFFAKGHLIADADKIYKSEKDSTYFYANTVPMWQQINAMPGNWFFVEEYVRQLAAHRGHVLDVWVGGLGVTELEGEKIYLVNNPGSRNSPPERKIPVPRVLFKCALDKTDKEAACFLVVNNPYVSKEEIGNPKNGYLACSNKSGICDKLTKNHDNAELGYFYCCGLGDFVENNKKELGLEDLQGFTDYKTMSLEPL